MCAIPKENRPSISVSKQLLPEVKEVIATVARHNARNRAFLARGRLMIVCEAKRQGVQRIVITHASPFSADEPRPDP
jgi:hypothetical protein